jgi:hypothetical protein
MLLDSGGWAREACTARVHGRIAFLGGTPMIRLSDDAQAALKPMLAPSEEVALVAPAVGCTLVLTDRQLLLVRDGVSYRPRSGVRAWVLDRTLTLRPGRPSRSAGQLAIECCRRTTSVFYSLDHKLAIDQLVAEVRRRIYAGA